jgi:hypothetical protein
MARLLNQLRFYPAAMAALISSNPTVRDNTIPVGAVRDITEPMVVTKGTVLYWITYILQHQIDMFGPM